MKRIRKLTTAFLVIALLVTSLVSVPALAEDDDYDKVIRLAGASRYLTAVEVSKEAYEDEEADTVIIASGENFPDALAASALAGAEGAPILLAEQDGFRAGTLEEIEDLGATKAIVLGGEKALGAEVVEALEDAGLKVTRIAGENRYETATLIAKEVLKSSPGKEVFLVNGDEPWDALAIGPVAAEKKIPVLLTKAGALRDETKAFLVDNGIKSVVILGGEKAVSAAARAEIPAGISVQRVYGANREATAIEIAEKYFPEHSALIVASRTKFADALVGGYFGGKLVAPIMLVYEDEIRDNVEKYLWDHTDVEAIYILGGEAVVSKAVADELDGYGVVKSIEAIAGQIIGVDDYLEFKVNGKWVLDSETFGDYFGDEELSFLYDEAGTDFADQNGQGTAVGEGEYAVTYGELVSEFVPFEVAPGDAFSKVTEFVLVDGEGEEVKAVVWGDDVSEYAVKALKGVTVDGKAVKEDELPDFDEWLDSSNKDVIKVTEDGELVLLGLGDTALSFTFTGLEAIYYLYVKVEAGPRAAKSIANKNVKAFTYVGKEFNFTEEPFAPVVLDQYGDVIDDYEAYLVITKGRTFKEEGKASVLNNVDMDEAGTYTVTVYTDKTDDKLGTKLGYYTITLVTEDSGKLEYTLVFVDEDGEEGEDVDEQLDLNLLEPVGELYLGIRVSIKGVELTEDDLNAVGGLPADLAVTSSKDTVTAALDEEKMIITVTVTEDTVTGTTVIKLMSKDGAKDVTLASKNVTVVDTTPTLTLKLDKDVKKLQVYIEAENVWAIADYKELVAPELEDYEKDVDGDMIESVTFHGGDSPYAVVKVVKEFGGKSFTFNAMLVDTPEGH